MPDEIPDAADLALNFVETMFRHDKSGRLVGRDPSSLADVPRLYILRTQHGVISRFRSDLPDNLVARLKQVANGARGRQRDWPAQNAELLRLLLAHGPVTSLNAELVYVVPVKVVPKVSPTAINASNANLLHGGLEEWLGDVRRAQPFMAMIEDGRGVAVCASVRISDAAHCAGVETDVNYRRKGHAANAVAGWATAVRALGATPFYSTKWDNLASQGVARTLGLALVGADFSIT
jgi:hypothetical protein